jgi:hypothetical protein
MSDLEVFVAKSRNNKYVWYDPKHSHAATHITDTPQLKELAAEVIAQSDLNSDYMMFHIDMKRIVGTTDLIKNLPGDVIMYAKRLNRQEYTAFNKTRQPELSSLVTVVVEKKPDDRYELVSAWIGASDSPPFPGTKNETPESKEFWKNHSLAWGRQKIQPGTETDICPW